MTEPVTPIVNELNAPFWQAAEEGRLVLPVCVSSGRCFWPPSPVSPFVTGGGTAWRDSKGEGLLRGAVVYRRVFQKAFEGVVPYGVGLVELDEGPRLQAHIADPDSTRYLPGDRVAIAFEAIVAGAPKVPTVQWIQGGEGGGG
jgi:hypothetical protein